MAEFPEDQWSSSNLGDDTSSICPEPSINSIGGQLHALLNSDYESSLLKAKSLSPLIEEEIKEWETHFPNLLIKGTQIKPEEEPQSNNSIHEQQLTTQRLAVARRLVLISLFPEIQKLFNKELGIRLLVPKSTKKAARSKSSKPFTTTTTTPTNKMPTTETETKLTLPSIIHK